MHIPDNYLNPTTCAALVAAMAPIWTVSLKKTRVQIKEKQATIPLIGVGAAVAFLIMMFNVPVPGGTTAHATGAVLLAILLGPWTSCLAVSIALLIQAFVFGDGGILAYGANVFNMGFIMPFVGYGVFSLFKRFGHANLGAFVGGYLGINIAALATSIELGIQPLIAHTASGAPLYNPYPLSISIPAMMSVHLIFIGWIEATVTWLVYRYVQLHAPEELYSTSTSDKGLAKFWVPGLAVLALLSPIGLLASGTAWGEWGTEELLENLRADHLPAMVPSGMTHGFNWNALMADYGLSGVSAPIGYLLSAATALLIIVLIVKLVGARHATTKS